MSRNESGGGAAWYRSIGGAALVVLDLAVLLALVVGSTTFAGPVLAAVGAPAWTAPVTVPWFVYLFAVLGATGFVFTMLVRDFERSARALAAYNLRLFAALPLAAGVYLLSERVVGDNATASIAAASFATGLLVNTAYLRLRDLAVRLLSSGRTASDDPADDG